MARNRNFSRREERQGRVPLPSVPDLGTLTMPRKTNRAAAKIVASGDRLWDKRKVARKARKKTLAAQDAKLANPATHRLTRSQKIWLMNHLSAWTWDTSTNALVAPLPLLSEHLDELASAGQLPYMRRASLNIQALNLEQAQRIARRLPETLRLVLVSADGHHRSAVRRGL